MIKNLFCSTFLTELWQLHQWKKREIFVKYQIRKENLKLELRRKRLRKNLNQSIRT